MKKFSFLLLYIPLWYTTKALSGSYTKLYEMLFFGKLSPVLKEMFAPTLQSAIAAVIFILFVYTIAPKISLLLSSIFALCFSYLFLPISFFYENIPAFFLILAIVPTKKHTSSLLFFSLFFLTLLHTFSCNLLSLFYYGQNEALMLISLPISLALILLASKKVYPQQTTMLALFPLLLLPTSFLAHHHFPITIETIFLVLTMTLTIFTLLQKRKEGITLCALVCCAISILIREQMALLPLLFYVGALLTHLSLLFYASYRHPLSRSHA